MIELSNYLNSVVASVANLRRADEDVCAGFVDLSPANKSVLAPAMEFLGCETARADAKPAEPVERLDRLRISRAMLLRLFADTTEPRWSSRLLEQLSDVVAGIPGGEIGDVLEALFDLWDEHEVPLTATVTNFGKDVAMLCFTRHRRSYARSDLTWMVARLQKHPLPSTSYLVLRTLPVDHIDSVKPIILGELAGTAVESEAVSLLEEDDD